MRFETRWPELSTLTLRGRWQTLTWAVEIVARLARGRARTLAIPIEVLAPRTDGALAGGPAAPGGWVGDARRARAWWAVASNLSLAVDPDRARMSLAVGDVTLEIAAHSDPDGPFTEARLAWPPLWLGLRCLSRSLSDSGEDHVSIGDFAFNRSFHVRGREAAQVFAVLQPDVREALLALEHATVKLDDRGARLRTGGDSQDEHTLGRFVQQATTIAKALARALPHVPPPAVLARFVPAWRAASARLHGRLEVGGLSIRDARWHDTPIEIGIEWDPRGVVRGTVLRMTLDPPLAAPIDLATATSKLPRRVDAMLRDLSDRTQHAVFGPDMIEVTLGFAALDPEETLAFFDDLAAVAATLHSRLEGPYR